MMCIVAATDFLTVLLIDDLSEMRRLVELWLEDRDARVVGQAGTCEEAFPLIERHRPDVVVLDMHMPGRNGIECCEELLARHPRLLVVGFVSTDDPRVEQGMRDAGAVACFHKSRLTDLVAYVISPELRARARPPAGG